ncbi:hypothetical protein NLU13_9011 [Sarocladium strictum]|uniref:Zn(2)-C6 fungal-type domain-containing protein n=1 Tax=Sarocladium strictum TaxID=5046 RepID=A0AA39GBK0_SARSR|nr:hypothetical protein NLU13_9011 [Sarocladium strictum]
MPRKKRPYNPKIKGCTPCARRRIHCDLRSPQCRKCESRGLKCTGLTLELRTELSQPQELQDATSQGQVLDVQLRFEPPFPAAGGRPEQVNAIRDTTWPVNIPSYHGTYAFHDELPLIQSLWLEDEQLSHIPTPRPTGGGTATGWWPLNYSHHRPTSVGLDTPGRMYTWPRSMHDLGPSSVTPSFIMRPIADPLAAWKRKMCVHFSNYIATEMVAVDGPYNHWRHILLPFAHYDDLVLQAIVTVSSCHIHLVNCVSTSQQLDATPQSGRITFDAFPAEFHEMYQTIFSSLQLTSDIKLLSSDKKHSILITILVLLTGAMVTGRSDFPLLYSLLGSAFDLMGGESTFDSSDIAHFIKSQVAKFRFYGATMVDEQAGLQYISSSTHVRELLDSLSRQWSEHPEHNKTVAFVNDLTRQALDMYLEQAQPTSLPPMPPDPTPDVSSLKSIVRVQHFIETLQSLPPSASCEQVLIWATFVAASGCVLDEHTRFFEGVLRRHYARNRFLNVLAGLEALQKIWARNRSEKWTSLIAQTRTLVM